jgi:diguanylate cyclase (GGDEF)-like protein/PAS domain S-box-containing protein
MDRAEKLRQLGVHRQASSQLEDELGLEELPRIGELSSSQQAAIHEHLVRVAPNFLSLHAENGDYLFASNAVEHVLGYQPFELVGRSAYEFFHPDDIQRIAEDHTGHSNGERRRVEYRIRRGDGSWLWVETDSHSYVDEQTGRRFIVAVTRDVQRRHEQEEQMSWLNMQLKLLHEIALRINGGSDEELLVALRLMREALGMEAGMISRIEDGRVTARLTEGLDLPVPMGATFPIQDSVTEYTAGSVMVVAFESGADNPAPRGLIAEAWKLQSYIGTRLNVNGRVYGTLAFASRNPRKKKWSVDEKQLVNLAGQWVQRSIELALNKQELEKSTTRLKRMATRDSLTGLWNRAEVISRLHAEMERADRYRAPLCIAMLDLDHFKKINDTIGHAAGDYALRQVADSLHATLRTTDICGRYGGEEFLVIWPNVGLEAARQAAERLRGAISELAVEPDGRNLLLAASLGVAEYRRGETLDELVARADAAMYEAKDAGRNRVVHAS